MRSSCREFVVGLVGLACTFLPGATTAVAAASQPSATHIGPGVLSEYTLGSTGWQTLAIDGSTPMAESGGAVPVVDPTTGFETVYTAGGAGDLLVYTRLPAGNWQEADVGVAFLGQVPIQPGPVPFVDPVTGFQNVYATGINKDLIEFTRLADGRWITDDLTMATGGATIMGSPQPFVDPLTGFQNVYATVSVQVG